MQLPSRSRCAAAATSPWIKTLPWGSSLPSWNILSAEGNAAPLTQCHLDGHPTPTYRGTHRAVVPQQRRPIDFFAVRPVQWLASSRPSPDHDHDIVGLVLKTDLLDLAERVRGHCRTPLCERGAPASPQRQDRGLSEVEALTLLTPAICSLPVLGGSLNHFMDTLSEKAFSQVSSIVRKGVLEPQKYGEGAE